MIVFLKLTTAGIDSGPFDLYSNLDAYSEPFEENVSRDSLIAGYSTTVPDNATIVRITSKENCISSVDITLRDVECDLAGYTGEITTSSTTSTTTTICIRPAGLTTGNCISSIKPNENVASWNFKNTSAIDACNAFTYFRDNYVPGAGGGIGYKEIQYSQLQIGEILYDNIQSYTNCISVDDGYYWFQPTNSNQFTYFANTNPINIVTVLNGVVSAIDPCTYVP
jgi:hypothetical protein